MRLRTILTILLVGSLFPLGAASATSIAISTRDPVDVEGASQAILAHPQGRIHAADADLSFVLSNFTGVLSIQQADEARTTNALVAPVGQPTREDHSVEHVDLAFDAHGEIFNLDLTSGPDAILTETGLVREMSRPTSIATEERRDNGPSTAIGASFDRIDWDWTPGCYFLGDHTGKTHVVGHPAMSSPTLDLAGMISLEANGGTLSWTDQDGAHRVVLGRHATTGSSDLNSGLDHYAQVVLRGHVDHADLPITSDWGMCGDALDWRVNGTVAWTDASATVGEGSGATRYDHADLAINGPMTAHLSHDPAALDLAPLWRYDGTADAGSIFVDGHAVATASATSPLEEATLGIAALALVAILLRTLAPGALAALYSRIAPANALHNAMRQRLMQEITAQPGIHMRELQRRVGTGWGALRFHVDVLQRTGLIQSVRVGRSVRVWIAGTGPAPVAALPPERQRVRDALPTDGTPRSARAIAAEIGCSRQLAYYHLRHLAKEGHATARPMSGELAYSRVARDELARG